MVWRLMCIRYDSEVPSSRWDLVRGPEGERERVGVYNEREGVK
jgi:hypothetical protein